VLGGSSIGGGRSVLGSAPGAGSSSLASSSRSAESSSGGMPIMCTCMFMRLVGVEYIFHVAVILHVCMGVHTNQ
jgi:hypothetical protein